MATTPGGNLYDPVAGVPQDEPTALNRDARDLEVKSTAAGAVADAAAATAAANQAQQTANSYAGQIAQANATAGSAVAIAEGAAADVDEIKGPINTRLTAVETAAGYAPGDATDAAMTNIATQEDTQFRAALNAAIDHTVDPSGAKFARVTAALSQAANRPIPVVAIGSSTTAGGSASAPEYRWVNRLARYFQSAFPSGGVESEVQASTTSDYTRITTPGVHVYNSGEGGTSSATHPTDWESQKIAALEPLIMFHMVGANDYSLQRDPAEFAANVHNRINYIDGLNPQAAAVTHILIHQHKRTDVNATTYQWDEYRDALRGVAGLDPARRIFLDASKPFAAYGPASGPDPLDIYNMDQAHLTDAGYAVMADTLRREMGIPAAARTSQAAQVTPQPLAYRRFSDGFSTAGNWSTGYVSDLALGGAAADPVATTTKFTVASGVLSIASGGSTTMQGIPFSFVDNLDVQTTIDYVTDLAAGSVVFGLFRSGAGSSDRVTISGNTGTGKFELRYRIDNAETTVGEVGPLTAGVRLGVRMYRGKFYALINGEVKLTTDVPVGIDPMYYAGLSASAGANGGEFDNLTIDFLS